MYIEKMLIGNGQIYVCSMYERTHFLKGKAINFNLNIYYKLQILHNIDYVFVSI